MICFEYMSVFALGALGYTGLELAWRGWTHWTMALAGGVCFTVIYIIDAAFTCRFWQKAVMCAACVTAVEFVCGVIVNLRLGWGVWDYSGLSMNLMGQICPQFSLIWLALSAPALHIARLLRKLMRASSAGR